MMTWRRAWLWVAASVAIGVAGAQACRIIEPIPRPIDPPVAAPEPLPIKTKQHRAEIVVKDRVAEVRVRATFHNPNAFRMEGTYWFPLPAEAVVQDFRMEINGKRVKGELLDAKRARTIYEDIVRRQKDPALLEWMGSQMLKCRIFPMEANSDTRIELGYTHLLNEDAGLMRLTYPLRSSKSPGGTIGELVVSVTLESTIPIKTIYSPTHTFDIVRKSDTTARLSFEAESADPARDVEIVWSRDSREIGLSLLSHKPGDEAGYFLLTVTPKVELDHAKVINKDVVFVCDTSGSMEADDKIEQAKNALAYCVHSLNKGDRFNIVGFSSDVRPFKAGLVERSDKALEEADAFIKAMDATGGTAIDEALSTAVAMLKKAQNVAMLVFLTDGNPTIGETNVDEILKKAKAANDGVCRLFVFGVGYDVNTRLLDTLAEQNRGCRDYVKPGEDIEVKVSAFYTKVSNPVLSDVTVELGGAEAGEVYPRQLPDLFHGSDLTLLGRFKRVGRHEVKLAGRVGGKPRVFTYSAEFSGAGKDDYLPRLWALRKVAFLLDEIRLHGENDELTDEVARLGKLHGILTPYTSFIVVDDNASVPADFRVQMERARKESRDTFSRQEAGRQAVADSASISAMKGAVGAPMASAPNVFGIHGGAGGAGGEAVFERRLHQVVRETIRHVAGRTFYVKSDGLWIDSRYDKKDEARVKSITLWSEAFFALIKDHPKLGKILTETRALIVCVDGEIFRIAE